MKKALDIARAHVRALACKEGLATIAGIGLLVAGGLFAVPAAMFIGLVVLALARRLLIRLDAGKTSVQRLELAHDATLREPAPLVIVTQPSSGFTSSRSRPLPVVARALVGAAIVVIVALVVSFIPPRDGVHGKQRWTFTDSAPAVEAGWVVEQHAAATGGRALAKEPGPPTVMVVSAAPARDVRAMTRCKGDGCGLAFRIANERSFSVARVVGDRVELARVHDGVERVLASAPLTAGDSNVWQELVVEARGDLVRVAINGTRVIDVADAVPAPAGGVGLWAPERAWFDELSIETFAASPQAIEVLPLLRRAS